MAQDRGTRLKEIGRRVQELRDRLDMTQEGLGAMAGLSKSRISEIERGASAANGLAYLGIAEALGVPLEWLLTGAGPSVRRGGPPPIDALVSELAEEQGWSHKLTLEIATAMNAVLSRRTKDGRVPEYSREQILKIAEALQEDPDT